MAEHSAAFYALKKKYLQEEPEENEESAVTQRVPSAWDSLAARASVRNEPGLMEQMAQPTVNKPREANLYDMTIGSVQRGYLNSLYGQESFDAMQGKENEAQKYADLLASDKYNFQVDGLIGKGVSGAAELLGQQLRQWTDPETLALAGGMAGMASLAGKAGPQIALPEEVLTVPGAFLGGMKLGGAKSNLEIEAGHSYNELLENGVSEDTARKIAMGVGTGNAALELLQLDELAKSFKVLQRSGASDTVLDTISQELKRRGLDVVKETAQEVAQEGVTIGGTQLGSYLDKGEFAYDMDEVLARLGDTAASSALSFGIMNVPGGAYNIYQSNHKQSANPVENNVGKGENLVATESAKQPESNWMQEDAETAAILRQVAEEMGRERTTEQAGAEVPSGLNDLLAGGNRVDMESLTEHHLAEWDSQGGVWVDAANRAYQMRPEDHISQRTADSVSSRKINAFQFDHPELRQYVKRAAADLVKDASLSLNTPSDMRQVRDTQGKKYVTEILDSPPLRKAMDMGLSRNEIIKAAEDLIADHGQENYAAAKRLELILDEMLTEGYTTVEGEVHDPDTAYIQAKTEIPGYQERQREELPIWDMEEGVIRAAQAAYDAGRANVPRESATLVDPVQEEAYHAGRLEHIRNMKPSETVEKQETRGYTKGSNSYGLTEEETTALLSYKSSESYKVNAKLRDALPLTETEQKMVNALDSALEKLPTYTGRTYRNITFDGMGDQEAFDAFMADVEPGAIMPALAYTSTSTAEDGYPLDGDFVVRMVVEGQSGRNMDGFGNNFENEVVFERRKKFQVSKLEFAEDGTPTIYMMEVMNNGETDQGRRNGSSDDGASVPRGNGEGSKSVYQPGVQQVSEEDSGSEVQQVPKRDPRPDSVQRTGVRGVSAEVSSQRAIADHLIKYISKGQDFTAAKLFELADKHYGGTMAEGKYTVKDAYDAMELAVNRYLISADFIKEANGNAAKAREVLSKLEGILKHLPTQTKRT